MSIQDSFQQAMKLVFPKENHVTCIYTDASEEFWVGIVAQLSNYGLAESTESQQHEAMAFLGGTFTGTQSNWTAYDREAYAIVQSLDKMDYLFCGSQPVHLFTEHMNLFYVFAPLPC